MATDGDRPMRGRGRERAIFARLLASPKAELVVIYGRRRVGKTFLVRQTFSRGPGRYFEMVGRFDATLQEHLRIFAASLAAFEGGPPPAPPRSWHEAFKMLRAAIAAKPAQKPKRGRKTVLFFDELPWIDTHRSGALRELEHFWNAWAVTRDDLVLIVCGSAGSWMLQKIVHAKGGLSTVGGHDARHDRLTETVRLAPFSLAEIDRFLAERKVGYGHRDVLELAMIFGGVPHYVDHVARGESVAQLVDRVILAKDAPLANELDRIFPSLFGDDPKYLAVVRALAKRRSGLSRNALLDAVALPSGGGVSVILENLEQAGFVTRVIPFGRTSRDRLFRISDAFTLFHLAWLDHERPKSWQHVRRSQRWEAWSGRAFEALCLDNVDAIARALGISGVETHASAWQAPGAQIDLLVDRADNVISVCEMKLTDGPFTITKRYAEDLRRKLSVFRERTGTKKAVQLVMVTSHGLIRNAHAEALVDRTVTMDALFAS